MPIYQKIQKVMQSVGGVERKGTHPKHNFPFAKHDDVTAALRGHFAALGIVRCAQVTDLQIVGSNVILKGRVVYTDTDDLTSVDVPMAAIEDCGRDPSKSVGKAVSYAVKTAELKLFCLVGDPEPDSDMNDDRASEPSPGALKARAEELLKMVLNAKSKIELDEALQSARAEVNELRHVEGFLLGMKAARESAEARLGK